MKNYLQVGSLRLMDIKVIFEEIEEITSGKEGDAVQEIKHSEKLYEGKAEDALPEIKRLVYSKIEIGNPTNVYVHNQ